MPSRTHIDEVKAAELLWKLSSIVKKEFDSLPSSCQQTFLLCDSDDDSSALYRVQESLSKRRRRAVSVESVEGLYRNPSSPVLSCRPVAIVEGSPSLSSARCVDHHDWSNRASVDTPAIPSLIANTEIPLPPSYGKRKRETFVGQKTNTLSVRATLKKKFSWKQYPEVRHCDGCYFPSPAELKYLFAILTYLDICYPSWKNTWWPTKTTISSTPLGTTPRSKGSTTTA